MPIRTILHGGLGNQLFQLFYSELLGEAVGASGLALVTARLGSYAVGREMELAPILATAAVPVELSDRMSRLELLRLPKLLQRAIGREMAIRWAPGHALVDGYFQSPAAYEAFGHAAVTARLEQWRRRLLHRERLIIPHLPHLTHIRLTDFVAGGRDPCDLARPIVQRIPDGAAVMSDDEETIGRLVAERPVNGRPTLIRTDGVSSWEVLKAMSAFSTIDTNGSSLACWAASLTGATLISTNAEHAAFARFGAATEAGDLARR